MQAIDRLCNRSIPTFRKNKNIGICLSILLLVTLPPAEAATGTPTFPEGQRYKVTELKQGFQSPFRLRVESTTLAILHNILQIKEAFTFFCDRFGAPGVTKLRSSLSLVGRDINPNCIEIDLDKAILYYRSVGAVGSDWTESREWAGSDLDDVASALHYAKHYLRGVAEARQRFLEKQQSWAETIALCQQMDQSVFAIPELTWSLRGPLFSPQSEPETRLAELKAIDPDLAGYGERIKSEWTASQTVKVRIVEFSSAIDIKADSGSGIPVTYRGYDFVTDVNRRPVNTESLRWVAALSERGILADLRYIDVNNTRVVVTCQLQGVTASLVDNMPKWNGTYQNILQLVKEVETDTEKPAVKKPFFWIPRTKTKRYIQSNDQAIWVKQALGLNFKATPELLD